MRILTNYDFNQNQILNVAIQKLAAAPVSPVQGQVYFNTTSKRLFFYNGTEWIGADAVDAVMTGDDIITAINSSSLIIEDDNLSNSVNSTVNNNHTHSNKTVLDSTTAAFTTALETKLAGIDANANKYVLPIATDSVLGGIKSGGDITIDASGAVSVVDNSHEHTVANVTGLQTALDDKETPTGAQNKATTALNDAKSYTDIQLASLVDSAPETLNTLNELATALGDDPNFATTITNQIAAKPDKYIVAIGDGIATTIEVTHNLNTRDAVVSIRETAAPYAQVLTDVEYTTVDSITLKFAVAPATDEYTVAIIG